MDKPVVLINPGGKEGLVGLGGTRNKSPERNKRLWPLVRACASSYCVVLLLMKTDDRDEPIHIVYYCL